MGLLINGSLYDPHKAQCIIIRTRAWQILRLETAGRSEAKTRAISGKRTPDPCVTANVKWPLRNMCQCRLLRYTEVFNVMVGRVMALMFRM